MGATPLNPHPEATFSAFTKDSKRTDLEKGWAGQGMRDDERREHGAGFGKGRAWSGRVCRGLGWTRVEFQSLWFALSRTLIYTWPRLNFDPSWHLARVGFPKPRRHGIMPIRAFFDANSLQMLTYPDSNRMLTWIFQKGGYVSQLPHPESLLALFQKEWLGKRLI